MTGRTPFFPTALRMCAGAIVWAIHFAVIYGYGGIACALGFGDVRLPGATVAAVTIAATAIALAATLVVAILAMRAKTRAFEDWMTAGIAALAALAIAWEGLLPVFMLPACT